MQINAMITADSLSPQGDRLTSLLITFPRIILAEVNTHRMLSKNTSSSRAVPFSKMVESISNDPFIPIAWQKHHSGMQGSEYFTEECMIGNKNKRVKISRRNSLGYSAANKFRPLLQSWHTSRVNAIKTATQLHNMGVTKQLCNRLLEPFMWTTMLITGSKGGWDNFFELRNPSYSWQGKGDFKSWKELVKSHFDDGASRDWIEGLENTSVLERLQNNKGQAEIHIMDLAEKIYDAMKESNPKQLKAGEWHIPYEDKISSDVEKWSEDIDIQTTLWGKDLTLLKVKVSTAMAARTSYTVVGDEKEIDYERMIDLHDRLLAQDPPHSSPMEHCARAMSDEEYYEFAKGRLLVKDGYGDGDSLDQDIDNGTEGWCRNFKGFIQYRHLIEMRNGDKN